MVMSTFDLGLFFSNTLHNIMWYGFGIDWASLSLVYCKINTFIHIICSLGSITCLCLAIIDQYFATCSRPRWQQWCNIKLAHRLTAVFSIIWILHGIPYLIFFDHNISPSTNKTICQITNNIFIKYQTYGFFLTLSNVLPLIAVVFGLMAYHNARHIAHRLVPLFRRELDKQLTVMVLVQVLINFCTFIPYSIQTMYVLTIINPKNPVFTGTIQLVSIVTIYFCDLGYTVRTSSMIFDSKFNISFCFVIVYFQTPFYTYVCVSKRFRRQLKYVLFEIYLKRFQPNEIALNQITPEAMPNNEHESYF
jgi:hypothetical protein